jgi:hypothetical protein
MAKVKIGKNGLFEIDIHPELLGDGKTAPPHPHIHHPLISGSRPFAIITGDGPVAPKVPATVGEGNDPLVQDLDKMGLKYEPVGGFYVDQNQERSQIVYDIKPEDALKLALRHGQESIVYHDGEVPKLIWAHAKKDDGQSITGWTTPVPSTGSYATKSTVEGMKPGVGFTFLDPHGGDAEKVAVHYELDYDRNNASRKEIEMQPQDVVGWEPGNGGEMSTVPAASKTPDVAKSAGGVDMSKSEFTANEAAAVLRKHVEDLLVKSGKATKCTKCGTMMVKADACAKCGEMSVEKAAELSKVSPPGHEKQVEHIAEQYEKKGKSAGQAKAIAAATAWSQHNAPGHTHKKSELETFLEELEKAEACHKCGKMYKGEHCAKCGDMKVAKAEEHELHSDVMHLTPGESGGHTGRRVTIVAKPSDKHPDHYKVKPAQGGFPKLVHKDHLRSIKDAGPIKKAEEILAQLEVEAADLIKMITPGTVDAVISAPSHARALANKPKMSPQMATQRASHVIGLASRVSKLLAAAKGKMVKAEEESPKAPEYPAAKQKRAVSVMNTGENSSPIPEKTEEVSAPGSGGQITKGKLGKAELLGEVVELLKAVGAGVPSAKPPKPSKGMPAAPKMPKAPGPVGAGMSRMGKADEESSEESSEESEESSVDKSLFGVR